MMMDKMQQMSGMQDNAMGSMNMSGSVSAMGNMGNMGGNMGGYGYANMPMDPNAMMGYGNHNAMQGMTGYGAQNSGLFSGNFDLNYLLSSILNFGIKILFLLLVIGLVVGAFVFIKKLVTENGNLGGLFAVEPKVYCPQCGKVLQKSWNSCPHCGQAKATQNPVPQTV